MRVLKKLFLGDVVAKGTTRQLRKLTTEKPQEESIVGTWVFNSSIPSTSNTTFNISFGIGSGDNIPSYYRFTQMKIASNLNWNEKALWYGSNICAYAWKSDRVDIVGWQYDSYRTITIFEETTDETFISWLKANATKIA